MIHRQRWYGAVAILGVAAACVVGFAVAQELDEDSLIVSEEILLEDAVNGALDGEAETLPEADALDVSHCWLLTASQYLPPSSQISETLTASLSQTIDCPGEDIGLRARLLRSLSAVRPLQAISPLIDLICQIDHPGHQQLAAVCVEKILKEHGEEALQLLHKRREDLSRVLNDLKHQRATVRAFEPEKPWHHPPGSPGWFAEVERAIKALKRLLQ